MAASGKEYRTEQLRNVAVLGHGGSGKTTVVDALCFSAGTSRRKGNVEEGHALTMTTPEELDHGISMQVTPAHAEFNGTKINFLDTPGFLDFTGEALAAVRVADGALIVVGSTTGVEVGTEIVWKYCEDRKIPRMFFVSMMDKEHADFDKVFLDIKNRLAPNLLPVEVPIGQGENFKGIINLFSERAHIYKAGTLTGEYEETDIPEELKGTFEKMETEFIETVATADEGLLERYLEGETISKDEAIEAMARGMARGEIVPLFCGSAKKSYGMKVLLTKIVELFPHPGEMPGEKATRPGLDQDVTLVAEDAGPTAALIFKTATEPHVGELSFFKVLSGVVENGMELKNASRDAFEKLNHLSIPMGKERLEVPRLHAGDIGVVARLKDSHTNDTLSSVDRPLVVEGIPFPKPDISVAIRGVSRSDEDKLGEVLSKIHEEEPTFTHHFNAELGQTICRGLGELHLNVQFERMKRKYGVSIETEAPKIAYRETITKTAEGQGRHKKQSGGRGQFGDCHIRLKPLPRGGGYEFISTIKGGSIPTKWVPSVDRGIQEASLKGILAGFQVVDFLAECFDGSYHAVDSSDIAFKLAGSAGFKTVVQKAGPTILEPIIEVSVTTPDEFMGDITGDITSRRGKIMGMGSDGGRTTIKARVPESELYKYAAALRSMTQGRAHHTREFVGYEPVPADQAKVIIAEAKKDDG
ncbi:MAG: elongation factor G [Longimicrobiales bacterium]|nr:elongation factor G [Longimicrobiales bacterium]